MLDANMIIANNIRAELEKESKKQADLAKEIGISKKTMNKIMNGARTIDAIELRRISKCLNVTISSLLKIPERPEDTDEIKTLMTRARTKEAREGIQLADELSDMILFHTKIYENGKKMERPWDDDDD